MSRMLIEPRFSAQDRICSTSSRLNACVLFIHARNSGTSQPSVM